MVSLKWSQSFEDWFRIVDFELIISTQNRWCVVVVVVENLPFELSRYHMDKSLVMVHTTFTQLLQWTFQHVATCYNLYQLTQEWQP